ncbi:hypothetical protein CVT26_007634 [Gymnopilus dilepis]|uniref:F-box domain-containing protein n=1 Tax=Gymnopilus dilepis TaxID=231916 RepID=A0A409VZP1_9AGAR|nr:hypothetical protein CVT26_007634 [Gymnopilus dilepis]
MPSPFLPQELLFHIIDNVDPSSEQGQQSLRATSLAGHALRIICQERLFQKVQISYVASVDHLRGMIFILSEDERTTGQRFRDVLNRSPHIGAYVQSLTINTSKKPWSGSLDPEDMFGLPKCYSELPSFSLYSIVAAMPNLKKFSVSSSSSKTFFAGNNVGKCMHACLSSIVSRVTDLDLTILPSIPVSIFSGSSSLQDLRVSSLKKSNTLTAQGAVTKTKLRKLMFLFLCPEDRVVIKWLNSPHSPLDISELRSLSGSIIPLYSASILNEWLPLCFSALEELKFTVKPSESGSSRVVDLKRLLRLRQLKITATVTNHNSQHLVYISRTLNTLPFRQLRPRQLHLELTMRVNDLPHFGTNLPLLHWTDLVTTLEDNRAFPCFSQVKIRIGRFESRLSHEKIRINTSVTELTQILDKNDGLRKLRERGLLSYMPY